MFTYLEIESFFCINLTCVVTVVSAKENLFHYFNIHKSPLINQRAWRLR